MRKRNYLITLIVFVARIGGTKNVICLIEVNEFCGKNNNCEPITLFSNPFELLSIAKYDNIIILPNQKSIS